MARIEIGNTLADPKLAPGWKLSDDGFGLRTAQATYNVDQSSGFDYVRGEAFPISEYGYLKLHRQTATFDKLGIEVQVCEYVGIDPEVNGGEYTNAQVGSSNSLTSENITAHPNFFELADGYFEVIAGTSYTPSKLGPTVTLVNEAGAKVSADSCIGENGACFERAEGGRFIGFVDPAFPTLYGKTQYLAPTTAFSGHVYVQNTSGMIAAFKDCLGKTSKTRNWDGLLMDIVPSYFGSIFQGPLYDQLLLSQVNYEDYADLVKISYEIRFSKDGWDNKVYISASSP